MPEARSLKGNQGIKASSQTFDAHLRSQITPGIFFGNQATIFEPLSIAFALALITYLPTRPRLNQKRPPFALSDRANASEFRSTQQPHIVVCNYAQLQHGSIRT